MQYSTLISFLLLLFLPLFLYGAEPVWCSKGSCKEWDTNKQCSHNWVETRGPYGAPVFDWETQEHKSWGLHGFIALKVTYFKELCCPKFFGSSPSPLSSTNWHQHQWQWTPFCRNHCFPSKISYIKSHGFHVWHMSWLGDKFFVEMYPARRFFSFVAAIGEHLGSSLGLKSPSSGWLNKWFLLCYIQTMPVVFSVCLVSSKGMW